ncbi:hypothetical protein AB0Q90_36920 [Streptomyces sp. NPDC079141]|uniref:hypothetical protein n=1 Tax=Streptomyces sp. NPDC079141 TaxID=3155056 RepID=UPI0034356E96
MDDRGFERPQQDANHEREEDEQHNDCGVSGTWCYGGEVRRRVEAVQPRAFHGRDDRHQHNPGQDAGEAEAGSADGFPTGFGECLEHGSPSEALDGITLEEMAWSRKRLGVDAPRRFCAFDCGTDPDGVVVFINRNEGAP